MDSLDREVLEQARGWLAERRRVWLTTVVETWGSSPRPAGAMLALRDDGLVVGSVCGVCIEDDLVRHVRASGQSARRIILLYGVDKDQAARFGLPCGGTLRLLQEPIDQVGWIEEVLKGTSRHELVRRVVNIECGCALLESAQPGDSFAFDGQTLRTIFGPRCGLFLVGAGELSRVLAQMAMAVDFLVFVWDPRQEYPPTFDDLRVTVLRDMPDDAVVAIKPDAHTAIVALAHDPKLDDMAVLEALKSPAFYVGAPGSRRNTAKRRERLALFDLSEDGISRLHGPVGLHIGSRTPAEIAVAVLAETVSVKNGITSTQKKKLGEAAAEAL